MWVNEAECGSLRLVTDYFGFSGNADLSLKLDGFDGNVAATREEAEKPQ